MDGHRQEGRSPEMKIVTKEQFEAFLDRADIPMNARREPRIERDVEYTYECYDNKEGCEIAFVSHACIGRDSETTYYIKD